MVFSQDLLWRGVSRLSRAGECARSINGNQQLKFDKIFSLQDYRLQIEECQKKIIEIALEKTKGNKAQAARNLGIHVTHFHKLFRQFFKTE